MKRKHQPLGILILLFIAGFLTFGIIRNYQLASLRNAAVGSDVTAEHPLPTQSPLPPPPVADATDEDKKAYRDAVIAMAQDLPMLVLQENCQPSALVLSVASGTSFTLKNIDSVKHTLVVNAEHTYAVPANGQITVTADFGRGKGIYDYACDDSLLARGLILVR